MKNHVLVAKGSLTNIFCPVLQTYYVIAYTYTPPHHEPLKNYTYNVQ